MAGYNCVYVEGWDGFEWQPSSSPLCGVPWFNYQIGFYSGLGSSNGIVSCAYRTSRDEHVSNRRPLSRTYFDLINQAIIDLQPFSIPTILASVEGTKKRISLRIRKDGGGLIRERVFEIFSGPNGNDLVELIHTSFEAVFGDAMDPEVKRIKQSLPV